MRSKVVAAEMARAGGAGVVIASGRAPGVVAAAAAGEPVGTRFRAEPSPLPAYKLWVRYGKPVRGRLTVDGGALRAVRGQGTSLLPVGVTAVDGAFAAGDAVELAGPDGAPFAVGISDYPAAELRRVLGRRGALEAVHRDNLVLL
jgi:glutamate 5-kinase